MLGHLFGNGQSDESHATAIDSAWRIHSSLVDWTGKVDQKASFILAIQSAIVAGVVTMSGTGGLLRALNGPSERIPYYVGLVLLAAGVISAAGAVIPNLRKKKVDAEASKNYIFFGHLRKWDAKRLERTLKTDDLLPVLTRQLIVMSEIAWKKHRRLQKSLWLAGFGTSVICYSLAQHHHLFSQAARHLQH